MTKEKREQSAGTTANSETQIVIRFWRVLPVAAAISALTILVAAPTEAQAQQTSSIGQTRGASGLPLPRFVSLKARRVNMRVGPGRDYAVDWLYLKAGLPMEIVQEYDNWMKVRDADGSEGWIYRSLLTGKRTAIAEPWNKGNNQLIEVRVEPDSGASVIAKIQPGVTGIVVSCDGQWCRMAYDGVKGWLKQSVLWGVYPDEAIKD